MKNGLDGWLRDYGNKTKAQSITIKTYRSKILRLITDFTEFTDRYNGDWMAWKEELAKKKNASSPTGTKRISKKQSTSVASQVIENQDNMLTHAIHLPTGNKASLRLPANMSALEIRAAWKQLDALKALVEAQAAAMNMEDEDLEIE